MVFRGEIRVLMNRSRLSETNIKGVTRIRMQREQLRHMQTTNLGEIHDLLRVGVQVLELGPETLKLIRPGVGLSVGIVRVQVGIRGVMVPCPTAHDVRI